MMQTTLTLLVTFIACFCQADERCSNHGTYLAEGCTFDSDCTPYANGKPVKCLQAPNGQSRKKRCCTVVCSNGGKPTGFTCSINSYCGGTGSTVCLNGNCCTVPSCPDGGTKVATGCENAAQCTTYTKKPVKCVNSVCCETNPCKHGGQAVGTQSCQHSKQCQALSTEPVACINQQCCTVPQRCSDGRIPLGIFCQNAAQCVDSINQNLPVSCENNMCCRAS